MQYKNIIFDLGNVLVKLNPEGCIGAFKAIGMGELANPKPQSEGMKLMSKLGVGRMEPIPEKRMDLAERLR